MRKRERKVDMSEVNDFRMTEEDFVKAEQEIGGKRLSEFVKAYDLDMDEPVAVYATYVQKHYGKLHTSQLGAITGNSFVDAIENFSGAGLDAEIHREHKLGKGYIITRVVTGEEAESEIDKQRRTSASVRSWYDK